MRHAKRIGALICVIVLCFVLMVCPSANAIGLLSGQQMGAWLASALAAINIVGQTILPAPGPVDPWFQWVGSPGYYAGEEYNYPVQPSILSNYLNASTIQVRQGVTTIDGVVYDDLWVEPGTFTTGLKTNIFDFKTKWSILSGQSGTLVTGAGNGFGLNFYNVNGNVRTQTFTISGYGDYKVGVWNYPVTTWTASWPYHVVPVYGSLKGPEQTSRDGNFRTFFSADGTNGITMTIQGTGNRDSTKRFSGTFNRVPFQFDYVSGIVPASESDIPENYGLSIQIPHDKLETFYNTYPQYNVDNSVINIQQDQIDIDELTQAIFDQIQSMDDLRVEWNEGPVEPEPEPEPPAPVEDVIEGLNVIAQQQFEQMQQQTQIQQQQQQTQEQQLHEQQQISQNTSEINDSLKDVTAVPDAEQLPDFKFDLRDLFPFCIPFDIYRLLSSFDAEPVAPHVQLPIVIESIGFSYNLDLDFSAWNPVAQAMRTAELIVYAIGLAWATGKVIKW